MGLSRVNRVGHPEAPEIPSPEGGTCLTAQAAARHHTTRSVRAADAELLKRFHRDRRPADRDALVRRYLPLARHVAARFGGGSVTLDELQLVAALGLLKSIDRFDLSRGSRFSSYAVHSL